jgi:predicted ribonuclease YlaK
MLEFGNRKKFHPHDLNKITPHEGNQERYLEALFSDIPVVLGLGAAGVGKSSLALYSALHQVFDESTPYDKVHIIRNIVESGERIGFLPGSASEKLAPYEAPYRGLCQEFLNYFDPYDKLKELDYVEFHCPNFIRGVTLEGIIIIEEVQNMDYATIRDIISRAGENTKVVINGDVKQNDLSKLHKTTGLPTLLKVLNLMPYGSSFIVEFGVDDIVRSGLVRDFLIADMDYESSL